ncbi:hypothetical protein FIBSPDRAFT_706862, partial [Athelia psychrophila]
SSDSKCIDLTHCRTVWSIIWSSLATIFACAWVSVHRNLPNPASGGFTVTMEQISITVLALLVPEYIVVWVIRQWIVAREISKEFNEISHRVNAWSVTHGFFVLMGGFYYFKDNKPQ